MVECSGKSLFPCREAVTGRLFVAEKSEGHGNVAKILLWDGFCELSYLDMQGAVGIVILPHVPCDKTSKTLKLAEFFRLPVLMISEDSLGALLLSDQKIAILDSERKKLYVDPDIETINSFFGVGTRKVRRELCILEEYAGGFSTCDGIVIENDPTRHTDEESFYEFLCGTADENTGKRVVATVNFAIDPDTFVSRIRAVYRASVWGRFSLLCTGVSTPTVQDKCISLLHSAYCQLDREAREFNGFIPKGLEISNPFMLFSPPKCRLLDFFSIDYAHLRGLITDSHDKNEGDTFTAECIAEFARRAPHTPLSIRSGGELTKGALAVLLSSRSVWQIYARSSEISALTSWL